MREFLNGLELEAETIDTIMAEHGKLVTKDKEKITELTTKLDGFKDVSTKIDTLTAERDDYKTKYETEFNGRVTRENGDKISGAGIDDKFKDFVMSEVNKNVNNDTDFDKALKEYVEKNPQYKKNESTRKVNSSFSVSGGGKENASSNSAFNNAILGALGKK